MPLHWWGGPPVRAGRPRPAAGITISASCGASRPTGASAADRGVRPTVNAPAQHVPAASLEIVLVDIPLVKDEGLAQDHLAAAHLNRPQPPGLQRILAHAALHQ